MEVQQKTPSMLEMEETQSQIIGDSIMSHPQQARLALQMLAHGWDISEVKDKP